MKQLILSVLLLFLGAHTVTTQNITDNAIGLRIGASDGFGTEISYQRALGNINRLEVDLGWKSGSDFDGFRLAGLYQWIWNLDGNFNWYAGAGGGLGNYNHNTNGSDTFVFAAGNIGVEYNLDMPLLLSLDFRPEIGFGDFNNNLDFDIAFGIRYQF